MAIDSDHPQLVLEALRAADTVDAAGIDVVAEGDVLVLRGAVGTPEEATAAASIAQQHVETVRSELRVDVNLREGPGTGETDPGRPDEALQGSSFDPVNPADDLVSDLQESLTENLPWDPPHEAVEVPTRAEERGIGTGGSADDGEDHLIERGGKSLPDLSPEELARAARPQPRDEETS